MYGYYRLRVILLSLGVVLGFGSGIAHVFGYRHHHHHHDCAEHGWSWDRAPWDAPAPAPAERPAPKSAPAPGPVQ